MSLKINDRVVNSAHPILFTTRCPELTQSHETLKMIIRLYDARQMYYQYLQLLKVFLDWIMQEDDKSEDILRLSRSE